MILRIFELARPKTLILSFSPVFVALQFAQFRGFSSEWSVIIAAFVVPFLLQIVANAHNDAKDFERGVDTEQRLGPKRLAVSGEWSVKKIYRFVYVFIFLALIPSVYLVWFRGGLILVAGLLSIFGAFLYTGGKYPISYTPFGELWVVLFFGLLATVGSYFIFSGGSDFTLYPIAISMGLLAANVLLVNNYRDMDTDKIAGKMTLSVKIGRENSIIVYKIFFMLAHFATLSAMYRQFEYPLFLLPLIGLPFFLKTAKALENNPVNATLNPFLGKTAMLQALHALLISVAYLSESLIPMLLTLPTLKFF